MKEQDLPWLQGVSGNSSPFHFFPPTSSPRQKYGREENGAFKNSWSIAHILSLVEKLTWWFSIISFPNRIDLLRWNSCHTLHPLLSRLPSLTPSPVSQPEPTAGCSVKKPGMTLLSQLYLLDTPNNRSPKCFCSNVSLQSPQPNVFTPSKSPKHP